MKTNLVQIVFCILGVVLAAALQERLPSFGGVKAPILLLLAAQNAFAEKRPPATRREGRPRAFRWMVLAAVAGAFEDALNGFPSGCGISFFLLTCLLVRVARPVMRGLPVVLAGVLVAVLAAPFHEVWLAGWGVIGDHPPLWIRFFASTLPAILTGAGLFLALPWLQRIVGFDGLQTEGGNR